MTQKTIRRGHGAVPVLGVLAAGILTLGNARADDELTKITFGLDWFAKAEHGGFFQAKATGIYEQYGLDVTIEVGGPQVNNMQLLLAGNHDLTMGYPIRNIDVLPDGLPVISVATTFQKDPQVVITKPSIESLGDLKGGSMLVAGYADTTYWPWLEKEYGFTDDMKAPYTGSLQPFISGRVDAQQGYVTNEPFSLAEQGIDFNVFLMADLGYPAYAGVIQTTHEMVRERPEVVRNFIQATLEGWRSYFRNPEPANELVLEYNPEMTPERIAYAIEKMKQYQLLTGGAAVEQGIGIMTHERWKQIYEFMVSTDLADEDVDYTQAYTLEFLPEEPIFLD